jgi:pantoate--beta-alanine ligase
VRIVPTTRDPLSGLALSSRNAYLTADEHEIAGATLYEALCAGQHAWLNGESKDDCIRKAHRVIEDVAGGKEAIERGVNIRLDYIEMNDTNSFEVLGGREVMGSIVEGNQREAVILSGAIWVGQTRLIDNVILGDIDKILA